MSTNVYSGPIDSDSDHDDLDMTTSVYIDMRPELFVDFLRLKKESVNSS